MPDCFPAQRSRREPIGEASSEAGWYITRRPEIADIYDTRYAYAADALGTECMLDNNFRLRKRRSCT